MIGNGFRGVLAQRLVVINLHAKSHQATREINGFRARLWGIATLVAGSTLTFVALWGFAQNYDFLSSPAYLQYILPSVEGQEVIYGLGNGDDLEIAYGFHRDKMLVYREFSRGMQDDGWTLLRDTPISIVAAKQEHQVTLSFIGMRPGDQKSFPCKVIIRYHRE